jgi:transposase InsO family protein
MTIDMDDKHVTTLAQVKKILESAGDIRFRGLVRQERYAWIESVLKRFDYFKLGRKDKGLVKAYLERISGFSRAQITRLLKRQQIDGKIRPSSAPRNRFATTYTAADKELLARTDNAHGRLSGPATRRILQRQFALYGDERFARLRNISSAHIYNLRKSRIYEQRSATFAKTRSVSVAIGTRRKPQPEGKPGYIRVDTVHQGDLDGRKGVYHINLVDEVTQWEIVTCVARISEAHLKPAIEAALSAFPFAIRGFHSDNGGEYVNGVIAALLNKLLIEQTKSRSGRTNDNALVEGKNGSVIRKHMGYSHIEQRCAPLIDRFYREHFNTYLNFHRPSGFPTILIDEKGRRRRKYKDYRTPFERLKGIENVKRHLRGGVTIKALDETASKHSDNEFAERMQRAKSNLFRKLGKRDRSLMGDR